MKRAAHCAPGWLVVALAVAPGGAWCTANAETLAEAWQLALARDKALAAAESDVQGAQAAERAARGARWPSLDASATYARLNASPTLEVTTPEGSTLRSGPIFKGDQIVSGSVQMKLPLYAGGQISASIDAAQRNLVGASADEQSARSLLKLDVAEAYVSVLRARRALQAASASVESLAAHGKALPQLALIGGYTHFDNQILDRQDFSAIGVGFTWNLFDGGQARNRAAALRNASRAAENRLEDLRSQIELQVRQAWLDVQAAQVRAKATGEAVAQAEENLRSSRELYGAGLATNTQVLNAVTLEVDAINNRDNATLDESLSLLRLEYAVGAL